jgi:hypothetical protein
MCCEFWLVEVTYHQRNKSPAATGLLLLCRLLVNPCVYVADWNGEVPRRLSRRLPEGRGSRRWLPTRFVRGRATPYAPHSTGPDAAASTIPNERSPTGEAPATAAPMSPNTPGASIQSLNQTTDPSWPQKNIGLEEGSVFPPLMGGSATQFLEAGARLPRRRMVLDGGPAG